MRVYIFIALIFLLSCEAKEKADLIVSARHIYTVAAEDGEAIVVKDGNILAVGSKSDILARYEATNIVDYPTLFMYPGFIDAHCHFMGYGASRSQVDLVGTQSWDEVIKAVIEYAKANPEGWIEGRGWDQNDWEVIRWPDNSELSALFPDRPVLIRRIDGHAAIANEKALKEANIDISTVIEGGEIRQERGELTGLLIDNAVDSVRSVVPEPTAAQLRGYLIKAQEDCLEVGLTTVDDAGLDFEEMQAIMAAHKSGELKTRVYLMLNPTEENFAFAQENGVYKTDRLNIRSFKIYADGALGSRGARLKTDYHDDAGNQGFWINDSLYFDEVAHKIHSLGFQMNTHCIGDQANAYLLRVYGHTITEDNDARWRIEHAQVVSPEDQSLFAKYHLIPSVQPTHATSDMYWAKDRLGDERMLGAYAYQSLLSEAGMLALGSDFPVEHINPLYGFFAAVSRQDQKGWPEDGFNKGEALSREEALMGMTKWAAFSNFEEEEKGTLEAGKFADFVLLEQDIMKIELAKIPKVKVKHTYIAGELLGSY